MTTLWYPDATFVHWMQVQECIRLWHEAGNGDPPDWLAQMESSARAVHMMTRSMGGHLRPATEETKS